MLEALAINRITAIHRKVIANAPCPTSPLDDSEASTVPVKTTNKAANIKLNFKNLDNFTKKDPKAVLHYLKKIIFRQESFYLTRF